jgi:hypothetical protein
MKKILIILALSFIILPLFGKSGKVLAAKNKEIKEYKTQCLASREYITSVRYLRKQKTFSLDEKQIRSLADSVSKGCTGASKRFILITKLLVKTGLDSRSALLMGVKLSHKTEKEVKTFTYIFKRSFLKSFLDLDIKTSIDIAYMLADKFDGNHSNSQRTFNQILKLCNSRGQLDMPNRTCAKLAARVAKSGENYKKPLGSGFKKLFHYLIKIDGPNLPTFKAIEISENILKNGPTAAKNFIQAYRFGVAKKGLNITRGQAIDFAKKLASRTLEHVTKK